MNNLIKKLLLEEKKLEEIKDKIMRNGILQELNIKEINKEMLNEEEFLEETQEKLFGMAYRIMKANDWGKQKELIILERRLDTQKLERENKIKKYETRIKLIKDESKIEREDMNTRKINKLIKIKRIKEGMKKHEIEKHVMNKI